MRALIPLSFILSSCALSTLASQGRTLPTIDGEAAAAGLGGKATITRDAIGVPHIRAASEADAAYAMGYAHGQDRLFQMDLTRRIIEGRTAELLGERSLQLDIFMRGLGLEEQANETLRAAEPDTRFVLAAYAAGVNAAADASRGFSVEHRLLKEDRWEPWTPADSITTTMLFSWSLAKNPSQELASFLLRDALDRGDLQALFQINPDAPDIDASWGKVRTARTGELTEPFQGFMNTLTSVDAPQASNAWAIGIERSASGAPLLANDPHLGRSVPSPWYLAEVSGGELHAAGVTVPGIPFVVSGHNAKMAWGVTNASADYVDFAVLERDGDTGYRLNGESHQLEDRRFELQVKDLGIREGGVMWTDIGPVVTELDGKHLLVMRWNALESTDRAADIMRTLNQTALVEDAIQVLTQPSNAVLNFVMADTEGNIGWQTVGSLPNRLDHTGIVPHLASEPGQGWDGWQEELPGELQPERGYVVSANERHHIAGEPAPNADLINPSPILPWRHDRIDELLGTQPTHDLESLSTVQLDTLDTHAQAVLPKLIDGLDPRTEGAVKVLEQLKGWDFGTNKDQREPAVWAVYQQELLRVALEEKLGPDGLKLYMQASGPGRSMLEVDGSLERFVPDRDAALRQALLATWDRMVATYGEDEPFPKWGDVHMARYEHPFAAAAGALLNAGEVELPGSANTVNVAAYRWAEEGFEARHVASMRMITELTDPPQSNVVLPPGNSGQPASRHYQDQLRSWARGDRYPLWFTDDQVKQNADATLVLTPG